MINSKNSKCITGLYVIVDPSFNKHNAIEVAKKALQGGANVIQWRDKKRPIKDQLNECKSIKNICSDFNAIFLINDYPELAKLCEADGVHLGQKDMSIQEARKILNSNQLIGTSNATLSEAITSVKNGADYIAVGAIFPTNTKSDTRPAGLETLKVIRTNVTLPIVAISGINKSNISQVIQSGADSIAVISAVNNANDPEKASDELNKLIQTAKEKYPYNSDHS
tara:strand:+ start:29387 stop:30058 length:672 start_codon:yes stop_codon:yes gene_type:complete